MTTVRQAAYFRVDGSVKPMRRAPRRRARRTPGRVDVSHIHPLVLAAALERAGGDIGRLDPQEDGSVRILNESRGA